MYADYTSLIRAGRVVDCAKASSLTDLADAAPFSIFIAPITNAVEAGDIVELGCKLPYNDNAKVPVVVGDWSPVIFNDISVIATPDGQSTLEVGTDIALYYAHIDINDR